MPCLIIIGANLTGCQKNTTATEPAKLPETTVQLTTTAVETPVDAKINSLSATANSPNPERGVTQNLSDGSSTVATTVHLPVVAGNSEADIATLSTDLPKIPNATNRLTRQNFAENFAQNALLAEGFNAISSPSKYQQLYTITIQTMKFKMSSPLEDMDTWFVKSMLAHHQAAIGFANIQLKYGTDETLQRLAQDTIMAQQAESSVLSQWLIHHANKKGAVNNLKPLQTEATQNVQDMTNAMLKGLSANNADKTFVQVLLPHHKGALAMAESELRYGKDKTIRDMAVNIISSQQGEITLMKNWLQTQRKH